MIDIQNMLRNKGQLNLFDGKGAPPEHDFGEWVGDSCKHCGATPEMLEDGIVSKVCPRKVISRVRPYYGKDAYLILLDDVEEPCNCDNCGCPETRLCICRCPKHRR